MGQLHGVLSVKADLDKWEAAVAFDNNRTSLTEIQETIEEQGYEVV
ncbi:hypothetical protein [Planococcus glaciei]